MRQHRFAFGFHRAGRLVSAAVLALAFVAISSAPAAAGLDWCEDDPVIHVGGQVATAVTGFHASDLKLLTGPITYVVVVPQSRASVTRIDARLATLPTVAYVEPVADWLFRATWGPTVDLVVVSNVPAKKSFSTLTTVKGAQTGSVEWKRGISNRRVEVAFTFGR